MAPPSLLHVASAKMIAAGGGKTHVPPADDAVGALRLLLVEEGDRIGIGGLDNDDDVPRQQLARSLAMDAAHSLVSNSILPCRGGCRDHPPPRPDGGRCDAAKRVAGGDGRCRCCSVALLVPGEPPRRAAERRKRRRRSRDGGDGYDPRYRGGRGGRVPFPMSRAHRSDSGTNGSGNYNEVEESWDHDVLNRIHVKYVRSLEDVVGYLAYAPSLPTHLRPLDGIVLLGAGEILSGGGETNNTMEFIHLVSLLSDTVDAMEEFRREQAKIASCDVKSKRYPLESGSISFIMTVDESTYSSMPKSVVGYLSQRMDFVASVRPKAQDVDGPIGNIDDDSQHSPEEWEIMLEDGAGVSQPSLAARKSPVSGEGSVTFRFGVNRAQERSSEHWSRISGRA